VKAIIQKTAEAICYDLKVLQAVEEKIDRSKRLSFSKKFKAPL